MPNYRQITPLFISPAAYAMYLWLYGWHADKWKIDQMKNDANFHCRYSISNDAIQQA